MQGLKVDKKKILEDAIKGLEYLHKRNIGKNWQQSGILILLLMFIVHRDVKPENILLQSLPHSDDVKAVLCDFAISTESEIKRQLTTTTTLIGRMVWLAPEQLKGQPLVSSRVCMHFYFSII